MVKKVGGLSQMESQDLFVKCLEGKTNNESADLIAKSFSEVSNQFQPIDKSKLPAFCLLSLLHRCLRSKYTINF